MFHLEQVLPTEKPSNLEMEDVQDQEDKTICQEEVDIICLPWNHTELVTKLWEEIKEPTQIMQQLTQTKYLEVPTETKRVKSQSCLLLIRKCRSTKRPQTELCLEGRTRLKERDQSDILITLEI